MDNEELDPEELRDFVVNALEKRWIRPEFNEEGAIVMMPVPGDNPIWQEHMREVDEIMHGLVDAGLIEVDSIDEDGEFIFKPTELGKQMIDS